jgi:hypothetical protein
VTVVISKHDEMVICHERAKLYQAGATDSHQRMVHFIGEGMLPDDRLPSGEPSPTVTVALASTGQLTLAGQVG